MEIKIMSAEEARKMAEEAKAGKLFAKEVEAMKHFPAVINIISKDIEDAVKQGQRSIAYNINERYEKDNIDEIDLRSFRILEPHLIEFFKKLGYSYSKWVYSNSTIYKTGKVYQIYIKW